MSYERDPESGQLPAPDRKLFRDHTTGVISENSSPDIPFSRSLNPYRGCEHGCIYCYARPTHEFLGFSAGLDFESRIVVKYDAPALLRKELCSTKWSPGTVVMSGVTDPYQPIERELQITRGCLEVLAEARNPVVIITKNHLVTRDLDLLQSLAGHRAVAVALSVTTLDPDLARVMEPRTSTPKRRLEAIEKLATAGIPVHVNVAPVIPGLTDHELVQILEASSNAGATSAAYTLVRLPYAVKDLFADWLEEHFPDRKEKVLNRIRSLRDGKLNETDFGKRFRGEGPFARQVEALFRQGCNRFGFNRERRELSVESFRRPVAGQQDLFDI